MVWKRWTKKRVFSVKPLKGRKPKSVLIAQTMKGYAVDLWYPKKKGEKGDTAQHLYFKRIREAERKFKQLKRKHPKIRSHAW